MATLTAIKKYFGIDNLKQFKQEWYELDEHEQDVINGMVTVELDKQKEKQNRPVINRYRPRFVSGVHMNGQMSAINAPCNVQTVY